VTCNVVQFEGKSILDVRQGAADGSFAVLVSDAKGRKRLMDLDGTTCGITPRHVVPDGTVALPTSSDSNDRGLFHRTANAVYSGHDVVFKVPGSITADAKSKHWYALAQVHSLALIGASVYAAYDDRVSRLSGRASQPRGAAGEHVGSIGEGRTLALICDEALIATDPVARATTVVQGNTRVFADDATISAFICKAKFCQVLKMYLKHQFPQSRLSNVSCFCV
jgi:hypothetical protein